MSVYIYIYDMIDSIMTLRILTIRIMTFSITAEINNDTKYNDTA
jgi:hypothetical protein